MWIELSQVLSNSKPHLHRSPTTPTRHGARCSARPPRRKAQSGGQAEFLGSMGASDLRCPEWRSQCQLFTSGRTGARIEAALLKNSIFNEQFRFYSRRFLSYVGKYGNHLLFIFCIAIMVNLGCSLPGTEKVIENGAKTKVLTEYEKHKA